jgi:hypothetical protein
MSFINQLYTSTFSMVTDVSCISKNGHVSKNYKTQFFFISMVSLPLIYIEICVIYLVLKALILAVY